MPEFEGVDFLRLDELLSDEERLARDTVRDFDLALSTIYFAL